MIFDSKFGFIGIHKKLIKQKGFFDYRGNKQEIFLVSLVFLNLFFYYKDSSHYSSTVKGKVSFLRRVLKYNSYSVKPWYNFFQINFIWSVKGVIIFSYQLYSSLNYSKIIVFLETAFATVVWMLAIKQAIWRALTSPPAERTPKFLIIITRSWTG